MARVLQRCRRTTTRHKERPMSGMTLKQIAKKMRDIDFTMLVTKTEGGALAGRPMSNNGDVEYDGDSWFFTREPSRLVEDLQTDPSVNLSLQGKSGLFGKPPIFIAVEGHSELIRDKAVFAEHWHKDMERCFEPPPASE
jgi:general stress protein 26